MRILTPENRARMLVEDHPDDGPWCMVLRRPGPEWDWYALPTPMIDVSIRPLWRIRVGDLGEAALPPDVWVIAGERDLAEIEPMPVEEAVRRFQLAVLNPLSSSFVRFEPADVLAADAGGVVLLPALGRDDWIAVPLRDGAAPPCVLVSGRPPRANRRLELADLL